MDEEQYIVLACEVCIRFITQYACHEFVREEHLAIGDRHAVKKQTPLLWTS